MPEVEIIDITTQVAHLPLDKALEYATQAIRELSHPVWAQFTLNACEITVAEDSDTLLLQRTVRAQCLWRNGSTIAKVGPYPTQMTFEEAKAMSYHLIRGKNCLIVRAYRLDEPGWVERINRDGESFSHWHGIVGDWYVKDPDAATIFVVPDVEFVQCSKHKP